MKAVVCKDRKMSVVDRLDREPGRGQVLLKVLRCGICGSDLHVRKYCDQWGEMMARSGYKALLRADQEVVFGHEFSGEVLDHGPGCKRTLKPGSKVVAVPVLRRGTDIDLIGLAEQTDGAYAERVIVEESMMMPIPNGLAPDLAALTEPMAVGWHAMKRGEVTRKDVCVVIGCGPVGLAIIALLKARGVRKIVASDFSAGRRKLAAACGADVVIDPAAGSPYESWGDTDYITSVPQLLDLVMTTNETLRKLPLPWWQVWRVIDKLVGSPKGPVVFECVGAPGVLQSIIEGAPHFSRIVVVGVCMQSDTIQGAVAINKGCDLRFAAGYSPLEFRDTLHLIAEGKVTCGAMITAEVGLEGVAAAFEALGDPDRHAKILIDPESVASAPPGPTPGDHATASLIPEFGRL